MIISRTPFRVSFLGGGTDVPWFYENYGGGAVISIAIDLHMYISCHPLFESDELLLKYSQIERVNNPKDLSHPIAREVLSSANLNGLDIGVSADVPAGTGLGSSSAFTVGLLNVVGAHGGSFATKQKLAERACEIEIEKLSEPIGKQDQFSSAFGGLNFMSFHSDGKVDVSPISLDRRQRTWLSKSLLLVRVGNSTRSASEVLIKQRDNFSLDKTAQKSLLELRDLTIAARPELERDISKLGQYINKAWELKKSSNPFATNDNIDQLISRGLLAGASGAKLLGAGGGGFVLFVCSPDSRDAVLDEFSDSVCFPISPDYVGSSIIYAH